MNETTFFAFNRWNKTVCKIDANYWEQLQTMFRVGIKMPDGDLATGIGRYRRIREGSPVIVGIPTTPQPNASATLETLRNEALSTNNRSGAHGCLEKGNEALANQKKVIYDEGTN